MRVTIENYVQYVNIQSEAAVRHLANSFTYDNLEDETEAITLRGGAEQVSRLLEQKLNERLDRAGIEMLEVRISHLAYAPEIANAMLRDSRRMPLSLPVSKLWKVPWVWQRWYFPVFPGKIL